ncbi:signal transduction histidine kinase [Filimonas zeae]|uniref:MASE11 domain-containing protein n=1 Tax=Filimonas zeae TaxID=1737353 RepID=A0A917IYY8_9BACT|nr:hypothetical protein [Filimonas zeae]MDR6340337.1 signal transduction histidine kinase [Filimonas zeae]GGH72268.1 hypothetical protein GCM10011379_32490 [Filimonas zeae]
MRNGRNSTHDVFEYWQNNLFAFVITWIIPVSVLVTLVMGFYEREHGEVNIIVANTCFLAAINLIVLQRSISLFFRKIAFAVVLAAFAIAAACCLHKPELGCMYLFTCSIFMVLFFPGKISYAGLLTNVAVFLLFSVYLFISPGAYITYHISLYSWIVFSVNFLFIDVVVILLIRMLLTNIKRSLEVQKELNRRLLEQRRLEQEQHRRLREIAFIQSHLVRAPLLNIKGITSLISHTRNHNIEEPLLISLEKSVDELDGVIRSVVERTSF